MSRTQLLFVRRATSRPALAVLLLLGIVAAQARSAGTADSPTGRIDFAAADLPQATVEVDLGPEMFGDLFGLGDAAVAGMAETLLQAGGTEGGSEATKLAADQLAATQQIMQLAKETVHEVRIRVFKGSAADPAQAAGITDRFDEQLRAGQWDSVVRVQEGQQSARISLARNTGAVRGVFIVATDGSDLVLVNAVCDVSPENVKKLTSAATKIGLENGLQQVIEEKMKQRHQQ